MKKVIPFFLFFLIFVLNSEADADRKRGFMFRTWHPDASTIIPQIDEIAERGANIVRWQIVNLPDQGMNPDSYLNYISQHVDCIEEVIEHIKAKGYNLKILVDQHHLPGGDVEIPGSMFGKESAVGIKGNPFRRAFRKGWVYAVKRLKKNPYIWGYDLANEPKISKERLVPLYASMIKKIRKLDSKTQIIVEPPVGNPRWMSDLIPIVNLREKRIIYSPHMYYPMELTHQNVTDPTSVGEVEYPNEIHNKKAIRKHLKKVKRFQQNHGVRILIGEFGFTTYSKPGNQKAYIKDNIKIYERQGYDWIYHAIFECRCWHPKPETDELLKKFFTRNSY